MKRSKKELRGYCGFDCSKCPTYIAWINNDDKLREELKLKYSSPDNPLEKSDFNCSGCKSEEGIFFVHCEECQIRLKALKEVL